MEWNLNVPKVLFTYWGEDEILPYMRYLTVKSFIQLNPDWEVVVCHPLKTSAKKTWETDHQNYTVDCDNYFKKLKELKLHMVAVDFDEFGLDENMSEVHRSDFLRLYVLAKKGGVWSDMDIIYMKPITHLSVNTIENKDADTFVCLRRHHAYIHSGGFLMSQRHSPYFKRLLELSFSEYSKSIYQGIGVDMFNKYYPTIESITAISKAVNISMDAVYAHNALQVKELIDGSSSRLTIGSIGVHWYAGHPQWNEFIKDTNGGKSNLTKCVISEVIKFFTPCQ